MFWWLALTNVIGEAAAQACIGLVGSGVYIILYSSVTIWAAIIKFKVPSCTFPCPTHDNTDELKR